MNRLFDIVTYCCLGITFIGCTVLQKEKVVDNLVPIQIALTSSKAYCGGAKPTPEILEKHQQKTSYPFAKIILHEGDKNLWQSAGLIMLQADSLGIINFQLKEGTYSVVFEDKKDTIAFEKLKSGILNSPHFTGFTEDCLISYFDQPDAILEVNKTSKRNFEMNKVIPCYWNGYPCARYTGKLPSGIR